MTRGAGEDHTVAGDEGDTTLINIGRVVRLQVQTASLKVPTGVGRAERYDPVALRAVPTLDFDGQGVVGRDGEATFADVHHPDHPQTKCRGTNAISIGFTSHYALMRDRFGEHVIDGIAGENIVVETDHPVSLADIGNGVIILATDGRRLRLPCVMAATPCLPFTRFALGLPPDQKLDRTVTGALQFLDGGTRGYYLAAPAELATIALGTGVFRSLKSAIPREGSRTTTDR